MNRFLENQKTGHDYQCDDAWRGLTKGEIFMKKNTYKFSVDVVFAYNIFSTDTQKNLNFTVTTDICRDNFSDAVAAFKTYDFWKGDDEESVEWAVFEVTTDKPFFLLSYEEYESIELTGFYDSFDEAFEEMKELIAESVNDVFDEDATADDVEDMEDYNVFVHSNKDSKDSGAPLAFASFCDDYPNREWTIFHI